MLLNKRFIEWELLTKAIREYTNLGYEEAIVPWVVSSQASMITCPGEHKAFVTDRDEHLVGSAEQGFIQLMMENSELIEDDKYYFSVSPCFRRDEVDELHSQWFMKLELFCKVKNIDVDKTFDKFVHDAGKVMEKLLNQFVWNVAIWNWEHTSDTNTDLMADGIEFGSYGVRSFEYEGKINKWVYGTGLALPRFQVLIENRLKRPEKNMMNVVPLMTPQGVVEYLNPELADYLYSK